jgi:hypothetical protein
MVNLFPTIRKVVFGAFCVESYCNIASYILAEKYGRVAFLFFMVM